MRILFFRGRKDQGSAPSGDIPDVEVGPVCLVCRMGDICLSNEGEDPFEEIELRGAMTKINGAWYSDFEVFNDGNDRLAPVQFTFSQFKNAVKSNG